MEPAGSVVVRSPVIEIGNERDIDQERPRDVEPARPDEIFLAVRPPNGNGAAEDIGDGLFFAQDSRRLFLACFRLLPLELFCPPGVRALTNCALFLRLVPRAIRAQLARYALDGLEEGAAG